MSSEKPPPPEGQPVISTEVIEAFHRRQYRWLEKIRLARPYRKRLAKEINHGSDWNIEDWLEDIGSREGAVTIEVGHGYNPWIKNHSLPSGQIYIGVEAEINPIFVNKPYIKDGNVDKVIAEIKRCRPQEYIFFIRTNTGFDPESDDKDLETNYNPESYLPSGVADQVLVTNTFDDSRLNSDRREKLFQELARLVKPGGKIIIHEDSLITFSKEEIEKYGLKAKYVAFAELHPESFLKLHKVYGVAPRSKYSNAEYFLVIEKPLDNTKLSE